MANPQVRIIAWESSPPIVIDQFVHAKKSNFDQVEWVIFYHPKQDKPLPPCTIRFDKKDPSPFADSEFITTDTAVSGPITANVPPGMARVYHYSVEVGGFKIDPGVVIWG